MRGSATPRAVFVGAGVRRVIARPLQFFQEGDGGEEDRHPGEKRGQFPIGAIVLFPEGISGAAIVAGRQLAVGVKYIIPQ